MGYYGGQKKMQIDLHKDTSFVEMRQKAFQQNTKLGHPQCPPARPPIVLKNRTKNLKENCLQCNSIASDKNSYCEQCWSGKNRITGSLLQDHKRFGEWTIVVSGNPILFHFIVQPDWIKWDMLVGPQSSSLHKNCQTVYCTVAKFPKNIHRNSY
jgi:hypothetical protein